MSKKDFVLDSDHFSIEAELQEFPFEKEEIEPEKPADGAVEKAFDKFLSLIERLLK